MGKHKAKKVAKADPDFKRPKHKLGKKLKPANATATHFRTAKIDIRSQKLERNINNEARFLELLGRTRHPSAHERRDAISGLSEIAKQIPSLIEPHIFALLDLLCEAVCDDEPDVREHAIEFFCGLITTASPSLLEPHGDMLMMRVALCLTHLSSTVRFAAVTLINTLIDQVAMVVKPHATQILERITALLLDTADATSNTRIRLNKLEANKRTHLISSVLIAMHRLVLLANNNNNNNNSSNSSNVKKDDQEGNDQAIPSSFGTGNGNENHQSSKGGTQITHGTVEVFDGLLYGPITCLNIFEHKPIRSNNSSTTPTTTTTTTAAKPKVQTNLEQAVRALQLLWVEVTTEETTPGSAVASSSSASNSNTSSGSNRSQQQVALNIALVFQAIARVCPSAITEALTTTDITTHILPHIHSHTATKSSSTTTAASKAITTRTADIRTCTYLCSLLTAFIHAMPKPDPSHPFVVAVSSFLISSLSVSSLTDLLENEQVIAIARDLLEALFESSSSSSVVASGERHLACVGVAIHVLQAVLGVVKANSSTNKIASQIVENECVVLCCDVVDPTNNITNNNISSNHKQSLTKFTEEFVMALPRTLWTLGAKYPDVSHKILVTLSRIGCHGLLPQVLDAIQPSFVPLFFARVAKKSKSQDGVGADVVVTKDIPGPFSKLPTRTQLIAIGICRHFSSLSRNLCEALVHMTHLTTPNKAVVGTVVGLMHSHFLRNFHLLSTNNATVAVFVAEYVSMLLSLVWWPNRPAAQTINEHHINVIDAVIPRIREVPSAGDILLLATEKLALPHCWTTSRNFVNVYGLARLIRETSMPQTLSENQIETVCNITCLLSSFAAASPAYQSMSLLPVSVTDLSRDLITTLLPAAWQTFTLWLTREFQSFQKQNQQQQPDQQQQEQQQQQHDLQIQKHLLAAFAWMIRSSEMGAMEALRDNAIVTVGLIGALPLSPPELAQLTVQIRADVKASATIFNSI